MPLISRWFDHPENLAWEKSVESPWSDRKGGLFFTYPLTWLLPYVDITRDELMNAPIPLWITDISPESTMGVVCEKEEGTFIVQLPQDFDEYLSSLEYGNRKKFRAILRKNEDIIVKEDQPGDVDALWPHYVSRLQELSKKNGGEGYTNDELDIRKKFYSGSHVRTMSFYVGSELVGINLSFWEKETVYDLACVFKPEDPILKRSIGTYAILKNINLSIERGMKRYDLLSRDYGYKRAFGAVEEKLRCIIVCSKEFAIEYDIPNTLYVESVDSIRGFSQ